MDKNGGIATGLIVGKTFDSTGVINFMDKSLDYSAKTLTYGTGVTSRITLDLPDRGGVLATRDDAADWALMLSASITTTKTANTLYDGRKFSNYRMLIFYVADSNGFKQSFIINRAAFVSSPYKYVSLAWVNSQNEQFWVEATYKSDTEMYIQGKSNIQSDVKLSCFGIFRWG